MIITTITAAAITTYGDEDDSVVLEALGIIMPEVLEMTMPEVLDITAI